jgi:hypothetical protein
MELPRHNSPQSLPGRASNSIETPRPAKQALNARNSSSNQSARAVRGVLEGPRAVDLTKPAELVFGESISEESPLGLPS